MAAVLASRLGVSFEPQANRDRGAMRPGDRIGTFEVLSVLGAGGMGVVYRALDTRLGREVAVKALPASLARDRHRLERFKREARALASLNHPSVATLHEFFSERETGASYLVMELIEGETLADRLRRGPIPVGDAIALFVRIADGLEAAHEKAIVHRDLKPANVKISPHGIVKILDFGVAAAVEPTESDAALDLTITDAGTLLGTTAYMSPEQAQGEKVDRRTDVWAFGVCLFEALSGRRPFHGDNRSLVLAAVLTRQPDWGALPKGLPPSLVTLLHRCLEKEPRQRLHDIGDARLELQELLRAHESPHPARQTGPTPNRSWRWRSPRLAALAIVAALLTTLLWRAVSRESAQSPVTRLQLAWADDLLARRIGFERDVEFAVLSPDGRVIVYDDGDRLRLRRLDALESAPLPDTENGRGPFFSPDGEWVGFFTETELRKIAIDRGVPETIAKVSAGWCGAWGTDGTIVFGLSTQGGLWRVPDAGGVPEPLTQRAAGEDHDWPSFLPDGRTVLFAKTPRSYGRGEAQIVALSLATGKSKLLINAGTYPRYSPSGHLLYAHDGGLFAVPFDPQRAEVLGRPVRVVRSLQQGRNGSAQFGVGRDGTLLYVSGSEWPRTRPVWVDRSGRRTETAVGYNHFAHQALSHDGSRLAAEVREPDGPDDLWIYDLETGTAGRITSDSRGVSDPVWTQDDAAVFFAFDAGAGQGWLHSRNADGSGVLTTYTDVPMKPRGLTPGGHVVGVGIGEGGDYDILMLRLPGPPTPIIGSSASELEPQVSADGLWIAYVSDESGRYEVYVQPYPSFADGKWKVSNHGGLVPRWHPKGGELFYLEGSSLMTVEIAPGIPFQSGVPTRLVDIPDVGLQGLLGGRSGFDVSPDGDRFLLYEPAPDLIDGGELILVLNWFRELERLVLESELTQLAP